jgi:U3 small nucleolar RNA-associated protein 13
MGLSLLPQFLIRNREQDFLNYLALNDYRRAIQLALAMEQPGRLLSLFQRLRASPTTESAFTGDAAVDEVLKTLTGSELAKLLRFVKGWNTNAKSSAIAQVIFFALVKLRPAEDVMRAFANESKESQLLQLDSQVAAIPQDVGSTALKEFIDAFTPYSERHLSRLESLVQDSYMIDFVLSEMDDGMVEESGMDVDI